MSWPPPVLAINRSNATPSQDTHPQDHNAVNLAMNDTVAKVQEMIAAVGSGFTYVTYPAAVVTTGLPYAGAAMLTLPSPGVWLFSWTADYQINTSGLSGFGYTEMWPSNDYTTGNNTAITLISSRIYEGDPSLSGLHRTNMTGLSLQRIVGGALDVYLRQTCFTGPAVGEMRHNGGSFAATKIGVL